MHIGLAQVDGAEGRRPWQESTYHVDVESRRSANQDVLILRENLRPEGTIKREVAGCQLAPPREVDNNDGHIGIVLRLNDEVAHEWFGEVGPFRE